MTRSTQAASVKPSFARFHVTEIIFDFDDDLDDPAAAMSAEDKQEVIDRSIGMWDADNEDDLINQITTASGWCIKSINYMCDEDASELRDRR